MPLELRAAGNERLTIARFEQTFIAAAGQADFILDEPYVVGEKSLTVCVNGMLQYPGSDYTEVDELTVRLTTGCELNDQVFIKVG